MYKRYILIAIVALSCSVQSVPMQSESDNVSHISEELVFNQEKEIKGVLSITVRFKASNVETQKDEFIREDEGLIPRCESDSSKKKRTLFDDIIQLIIDFWQEINLLMKVIRKFLKMRRCYKARKSSRWKLVFSLLTSLLGFIFNVCEVNLCFMIKFYKNSFYFSIKILTYKEFKMGDFAKRRLDFKLDDDGIQVSELLTLIEGEFYKGIIKNLGINPKSQEMIKIPGAKKLVDKQKEMNLRYNKVDLESKLENITLYSNRDFTVNFSNLEKKDYFSDLKLDKIIAYPIYNAKKDFFKDLFQMEKYANALINKGYKEIVVENLKMLKKEFNSERKYRILYDKMEKKFYLRAIVSCNRYYNYDNNVAIVLSLLMLHEAYKKSGVKYALNSCTYNESCINILFENKEEKEIKNVGLVKRMIEVSNDEVKRETFKFNGVSGIQLSINDEEHQLVLTRSKKLKTEIFSTKHNRNPKAFCDSISNIGDVNSKDEVLLDDIEKIAKMKTPRHLRNRLRKKVERSLTVKKYRKEMLKSLNEQVENVIDLLTLFRKVELIVKDDVEAAEYIRDYVYELLIDKAV